MVEEEVRPVPKRHRTLLEDPDAHQLVLPGAATRRNPKRDAASSSSSSSSPIRNGGMGGGTADAAAQGEPGSPTRDPKRFRSSGGSTLMLPTYGPAYGPEAESSELRPVNHPLLSLALTPLSGDVGGSWDGIVGASWASQLPPLPDCMLE